MKPNWILPDQVCSKTSGPFPNRKKNADQLIFLPKFVEYILDVNHFNRYIKGLVEEDPMITVGNIILLGKCCTCMHTRICVHAPRQQCICTQEARQSWKRSMFTESFYTYLLGVEHAHITVSVWWPVLSSTMCHSELEFAPTMTLLFNIFCLVFPRYLLRNGNPLQVFASLCAL